MSLQEQSPQFPIGFPIPQNKSNKLPYNFADEVFKARQEKGFDITQEKRENNIVKKLENTNRFKVGLEILLSQLDNYNEILNILNLSEQAFNSIDFTARGIIQDKSVEFYHLNHELFTQFKKQTDAPSIQLIAALGRSGLKIISNPNFIVNPKYLYCKIYNDYLKWLHGNNRTI